ncbi:MAG TPA: hypothetical protein DCO86_01300 [Spirochaetaceae bacterium]|nr:hypothetical protein [Spirochaetaceae bacterium]
MQVVKSEFQGFCSGVERAMSIARKARDESAVNCGRVFLSGLICHNRRENENLGLRVICDDDFDKAVESELTLVIGAHGASKALLDRIAEFPQAKIVSAICPVVEMNLREIDRLATETGHERILVYLGSRGHTEAESARSRLRENDFFVSTAKEAAGIAERQELRGKEVEFMVQTSFSQEIFDASVKSFGANGARCVMFNGICSDCIRRRKDVEKLAKECEVVIVVGDDISRNASELTEIASKSGAEALLVADASQLRELASEGKFNACNRAGVISSASSSAGVFDEVCECLEGL